MEDFTTLFKIISMAMLEIILLGALGFFLVRRKFTDQGALKFLARFVINVTLPLFIFAKIIKTFSFSLYPNWWIFPLIAIVVNAVGFGVGAAWFNIFNLTESKQHKRQLISLVSFQNAGYIPLILTATILSGLAAEKMFIYVFLFLLGFNLIIWSFGVWFMTGRSRRHFELLSLFSPPVVAIIVSLIFVALGVDRVLPGFIFSSAKLLGGCTLPLSMVVIGGDLATVSIRDVNKGAIANVVFLKLFLMPILALAVLWQIKPEYLIGFLIIFQAAVPPATSLSLITRHYNLEDKFISHGLFFTHLICIFSIPLWLVIYQMFAFFK